MYASVPTQERLAEGSPAGHFPADDQYPMRRDQSTGSFGRDYDPYARYTDGDVSGNPSLANLTDFDAASHMGLNAFDRNGNSASYVDGDKYEHDEDRQRGDPVDAGGRRHLRKGGAAAGGGGFWSRLSSRAKRFLIIGAVVVLIVIAIAIAVPAALATRSNDNKSEAVSGNDRTSLVNAVPSGVPTGGSNVDWRTAATGGDGSTVYMEDGSSFIYNNTFGKSCRLMHDGCRELTQRAPTRACRWFLERNSLQRLSQGASRHARTRRAVGLHQQSNLWCQFGRVSSSLWLTYDFGALADCAFAFCCCSWLTIEPFIVPGLFEPFNADNDNPNSTNLAIDEWTLSEQLGDNLTAVITEHYETFIVSQSTFFRSLSFAHNRTPADGTRFRSNCRCRPQLDPHSDSLLDYRDVPGRALPCQCRMELLPQSAHLGSQVRPPRQSRLACRAGQPKRLQSLEQAGFNQHGEFGSVSRCQEPDVDALAAERCDGHCERATNAQLHSHSHAIHFHATIPQLGTSLLRRQ